MPPGYARRLPERLFSPCGMLQSGVGYAVMSGTELVNNLRQIWENKPSLILLLGIGFIIFVFVVVDAWYLKRKKRRRHPRKH